MASYVATYLGTAAVQGPTSKPDSAAQAATYNPDGSFAGWVTPVYADGVAGGQTLIGGTGSGDDLVLRSSSAAVKGVVQVKAATFEVVDEIGVVYTQITQFGQARFANVTANGFVASQGASYAARQTTSIGVGMDQVSWIGQWADNTHASRRGRSIHRAHDASAARETRRDWTDGSRGYFATACQSIAPDGDEMTNDSVCLWMDSGVLKARYKDGSGVVSDVILS